MPRASTRQRIVTATRELILTQGYASASVGKICRRAKAKRGSFFHYFPTKDDAGMAALEAFRDDVKALFGDAKPGAAEDPLERAVRYLDVFTTGCSTVLRDGCLVGAMSLELANTHPQFREACAAALGWWAKGLEAHLVAARDQYPGLESIDPAQFAQYAIAVLEGSLLVARARGEPKLAVRNLALLISQLRTAAGRREAP